MVRKRAEACKYKGSYDRTLTGPAGKTRVRPGCECLASCGKSYLNKTSQGTTEHRESSKRQTKFVGCQAVEDELREKGLISYGLRESLTSTGSFYEELLMEKTSEEVWSDSSGRAAPKYSNATEFPSGFAKLSGQPSAEDQIINSPTPRRRRSSKKFMNYLNSLTDGQLEAIKAYIIDNPDKQSQRNIAKKLKISPESLRDRLSAAKSKFERYYR